MPDRRRGVAVGTSAEWPRAGWKQKIAGGGLSKLGHHLRDGLDGILGRSEIDAFLQ
jgi:hypothetical protein